MYPAARAAQSLSPEAGISIEGLEVDKHFNSSWYFSRGEIEELSPSRLDGIDARRENSFRFSCCTFIQDLGMSLKTPQVTVATAIVFCQRFYLRQSYLKNDRYIIGTSCMFLAGKVEETETKTSKFLRQLTLMSYTIGHRENPSALEDINKATYIYKAQEKRILLGERMVMTTLGFDLNLAHPYKPLISAMKRLGNGHHVLAQVAWNFVNDSFRTSVCLQFKPDHVAAGAMLLAAKFLQMELPLAGKTFWWQEFNITPQQLEEVSNQLLELYEEFR